MIDFIPAMCYILYRRTDPYILKRREQAVKLLEKIRGFLREEPETPPEAPADAPALPEGDVENAPAPVKPAAPAEDKGEEAPHE